MTRGKWNWTTFCGAEDFEIWSPIRHDFGICFQHLFLQIPVLAFFGILSAYYIGFHTHFILRHSQQKYAIITRSVISMLFIIGAIIEIIFNVFVNEEIVDSSLILLGIIQGISWCLHFVYTLRLRKGLYKNPRGSMLMNITWTFLSTLAVFSTRSQYLLNIDPIHKNVYLLGFDCFYLILHLVYAVTLIPGEQQNLILDVSHSTDVEETENQPLLHINNRRILINEDNYLGEAMQHSNCLSLIFFSWVNSLMKKGVKEELTSSDDLYDLPVVIKSEWNSRKLEKYLDIKNTEDSTDNSLFKALHKSYGWEFYSIGILKLIADCSGFAGPILLNKLVGFMENKSEDIKWGYIFALGLILSTFLVALCDCHFNFFMAKIGLKMRGAIITTTFKKILLVRSKILTSNLSIGEILNFMSTDTDRIVNSCPSFHSVWSIPFQLCVILYLLYQQVGIAFLAGLVFCIILIPINKFIAKKIGQLSTKMMEHKDARVKLTTETIKGYKAIKFYTLEKHFMDEISKRREMELKYLKGRKYLDALCVYFWATTPVIISILTIGTYILLGNKLTAAGVFTTIALLNMLVSPLNAFPWVLNGLTEAFVSIKRIQKLLDLPNMDYEKLYGRTLMEDDHNENLDILIRDGTFNWEDNSGRMDNNLGRDRRNEGPVEIGDIQYQKHEKFKLIDINFKINKGEFIAIIGPVGSGKSSFLSCILGELWKEFGHFEISPNDSGIGIVTQQPWLQRGTIRENVLFGKPYDPKKYKSILFACGLDEDMNVLAAGDMTEIGESGGTISGGQKARIALARAVYQDNSIYLFDDVLSAVDVKVAKHIFHHCIMGLLKTKTRILCTHQLKYLMNADKIALMENGTFKMIGKPTEVLGNSNSIDLESKTDEELISNLEDTKELSSHRITDALSQETSNKGSIELSVCVSYWKRMGHIISCSIIVSITLMQLSRNLTDWYLAKEVTAQDENVTIVRNTSIFRNTKWESKSESGMSTFLISYVAFACANTFFTLLRAFIFAYGGIVAAKTFHEVLLQKVLQGKCIFFDVTPVGRILNRFSSDTYTVDDSLPFILNILLAQLFSLIGSLFITVYGLPWICIILVPLVPIYTWLMNQYRITSRELKRISSVTLSPIYNHFNETLQGLTHIRAMRAQRRFQHDNEKYINANLKAQFASQSAARWLGLRLQFISVAIITGVSLIAVIQHQFDYADSGFIGLTISYALSITGNLAGVINAFTETEREMIAVERINQYIKNVPSENVIYSMDPPSTWPDQGIISFDDVTLQYRKQSHPSLKNLSFHTKPLEKIGIVGRTGAGKSSIIVSLFRLVDITTGTICIDSVNTKNLSLTTLRSRIFCIPQDPFLFSGSVQENLDPLKQFTENELWNALEKVNLTEIITTLGGLEFMIDENGSNFSVGQKQLICLARAILHRPKVLCIDEATANVDEKTDKLIQNTIRTAFQNCTVLTIAHRIQTIFDSDRILVMHKGEIVEFDKPDVLMDNPDSYFYKLVKDV